MISKGHPQNLPIDRSWVIQGYHLWISIDIDEWSVGCPDETVPKYKMAYVVLLMSSRSCGSIHILIFCVVVGS